MIANLRRDGDAVPSAPVDVVGMALEPVEDQSSMLGAAATSGGPTGAAELCIARFAASEGDVASAELHGLGRVSGTRFPRLGGVLHGRVADHAHTAALVVLGVTDTVRAGYLAAVATEEVAAEPVQIESAPELWDAFVPTSYRIPRSVATTAWDLCRFDDYWVRRLEQLGLEGDARRLAKGRTSALSRSVRGLSTVGVALAIAERGGRYDRAVFGRPVARAPRRRSHGRALPQAPRLLVD
jgi:hypothetical protein